MKLAVKREVTVKPAEETWSGTQTLSVFDQIGSTTQAGVVFFYGSAAKPFDEITDILIDSLSRTLVHFYPVAGRVRSLGSGWFELVCNGQGVAFVAAEIDATLASLGDFTPTEDFEEFLHPKMEIYGEGLEDTPVCFVQLTRFECGALCLSLSMSHVIADGVSAAMFVLEWARLTRGEPLLRPPFLQRTFSQARAQQAHFPLFDHSKDFCALPCLLKQPNAEEMKKMRTTMISLGLSRGQVDKLRKMANNGTNLKTTRPYTRYESISAHIWKCSSKARKHTDEQPTGCLVTVDTRRRVEPSLPSEYFGNAVLDVTAICRAGELMSNPLNFGVSKIRAAIEKVTSEYVWSAIDFLKREQDLTKYQYSYTSSTNGGGKIGGNPNVNVVNYVNLPFLKTDFGWGTEIHFGSAYERVDGDSMIMNSRNEDGSLVVLISLIEDHVNSFKKHFYDDILA